ncbi:MAG: O-antigen polymerase [Desulfuromonadales bacterium]
MTTRNKIINIIKLHTLQPHAFFFLLINMVYLLPIILAIAIDFREGDVHLVLNFDIEILKKIVSIYLIAILSFIFGTVLWSWARKSCNKNESEPFISMVYPLTNYYYIPLIIVSLIFLMTKIALIPKGAYNAYAFDTDAMTGGIWTFSMFCSEILVFMSIPVILSSRKNKWLIFALVALISSVNLLHGTRFFFIIMMILPCYYLYISNKIKFSTLLLYSPLVIISLLFLSYLIFLKRSNVDVGWVHFDFLKIISPVMYESIFSQMSLINVLANNVWSDFGSIHNLFLDIFYLTIPRILFPNKDEVQFIADYAYLSPMGAFSGYAHGLLYLGYFYWIFYLVLGFVGSYLYEKAKYSSVFFVLYVYYVCDFLFRVMRDGYIIPSKMLINCIIMFFILILYEKYAKSILIQIIKNKQMLSKRLI